MSTKNLPAYLTLVLNLRTRAHALGLEIELDDTNTSQLPEKGNYMFVRVDGGDAALIIPKQSGTVKWCDSHIDWEGQVGYIPLERENGAVVCRIDPNKADLDLLLTSLSGASKRARRNVVKAASKADMASFTAALQAIGKPASQQVSQPASEQVTEAPDFSDLAELSKHFE